LALGLNVSANDPILPLRVLGDPTKPYYGGFIIMLQRANIPVLPHIVNAVMIIAALSVENADIYVTVLQENVKSILTSESQSLRISVRTSGSVVIHTEKRIWSTLFRRPSSCIARSNGVYGTESHLK
jgi:hypothetical protein